MTGHHLWEAARDGEAVNVRTLLSTQGTQSFINYQDANGLLREYMALHTTYPLHLTTVRTYTLKLPWYYSKES